MGGFVDRAPRDDDEPVSSIARTTPVLADVVPLALAARARGEAHIDVEMSGAGREWASRVAAFGLWGRVVARVRDIPRGAIHGEPSIDTGPIARILVRYGVMEILDMHRREEIARLTPRPVLPINQRRLRPRNVTIR